MDMREALSKRDANGQLVETSIAEAYIIEEGTRQSLSSPTTSTKQRFLALISTGANGVNLVKGRYSQQSGYQVGRTWNLADLGTLESVGSDSVVVVIGKEYYWRFRDSAEKKDFCGKTNALYKQLKQTNVPSRPGWDAPAWAGIWETTVPQNRTHTQATPVKAPQGQHEVNDGLGRPRRPSRGAGSPGSRGMPAPGQDMPPMPDVATYKQRYKPHNQVQKKDSQSSLRQQLHQQTYGQPLPQGSRSTTPKPGKVVPPYPVSPVTGGFGDIEPPESITTSRISRESSPKTPKTSHRLAKASSESLTRPTTQQSPAPQQRQSPGVPPLNPAFQGAPVASRDSRSSRSSLHSQSRGQQTARASTGAVTQAAPTEPAISALPVQTSEHTPSHSKQQSDSSDLSFVSARDDTPLHEAANRNALDGSMHQNIDLTQASRPPSQQKLDSQASSQDRPHRTSGLIEDEDAINTFGKSQRRSLEPTFSPSNNVQLKKLHRLSPAKLADIRSPRRSKQLSYTHIRSGSQASVSSQRSQQGDEDEAYADLNNVLLQLQYTGNDNIEVLEKKINRRISQINNVHVSSVVSLDDELDQLDELLEGSIGMCKNLSDTFASVAVNLATIGPQIATIENKSEGSQVLDMNKRLLISEIERLLNSVRLPKSVTSILMRTKFGMEELPSVEANLAELYKAFEVLNSQSTSMSIAEEQADIISTTAESFDLEFVAFLKKQIQRIYEQSTGLDRVDAEILKELYPYSALVLFTKETGRQSFKKLIAFYEDQAKSHMDGALPPFTITWKRKLESAAGKGSKFTFKSEGKAKAVEDTSSSGTLKRGMSMKVGSHSVGLKSDTTRYQHKALPSKGISPSQLSAITSNFDELVDTISGQIAAQQQVLVNLFHMSSSSGRNYGFYIHQLPLRVRKERALGFGGPPQIQEADSSRDAAHNLHKILAKIFTTANEQIRQLPQQIAEVSVLQSVYLIGIIELKLESISTTDQEYTKQLWLRLEEMVTAQWQKFVENQSRFILDTHINTSKRVGILPVAECFVTFVNSVEASMKALGGETPKTRKLVDKCHAQIFRAITQVFSSSGRPVASTNFATPTPLSNTQAENKEALNYHVTLIENFYVIIQGLSKDDDRSKTIETLLTDARTQYRKELEAYIADVEQRPLGRVLEFLPKSNGQAPKFKPSTFKKIVANYDTKELRKNVDALRKRVQKHFGDEVADNVLVGKVWSAISAAFESRFVKIIGLAKQHDVESSIQISRQDVRDTMESFA